MSTESHGDERSADQDDAHPITFDITLDPKETTTRGVTGRRAAVPCLDVAFHPDLRRVGDTLQLPCGGSGEQATTVGRLAPLFHGETDAAPLGDPCISRSQLDVRYREDRNAFEIVKGADARRAVEVLDERGASLGEMSSLARVIPPGCYVAIGDRVLLRLSLRVPSPSTLGMIGISDAIAHVRRMVEAAVDTPGSVLVTGETGVGKELVARAIHRRSDRATRPFIAINCSALPESLAEAELFGHVRNAFTGARETRPGLLRTAEGGTAFLDEIAELSLPIQAKLLRTLQEQTVRPVGSDTDVRLSARLLFATHRDLAGMVESGLFRADLYRRIETPHVEVPPLRERPEDVPLLFAQFLCAHPRAAALGLIQEASRAPPLVPMQHVRKLLPQRWLGNVRSVQRHVDQLVFQTALHGRFSAPPEPSPQATRPSAETAPSLPDEEMARRVRAALEANDYNQKRSASALGVARSTLNRWMATFGIRNGANLGRAEICAALASTANVREAARLLGTSERALRLRMTELKITP